MRESHARPLFPVVKIGLGHQSVGQILDSRKPLQLLLPPHSLSLPSSPSCTIEDTKHASSLLICFKSLVLSPMLPRIPQTPPIRWLFCTLGSNILSIRTDFYRGRRYRLQTLSTSGSCGSVQTLDSKLFWVLRRRLKGSSGRGTESRREVTMILNGCRGPIR